ncbi:MAG: hypothetical protein IPM60_04210 [Rhodospirillales bacterium]|nr:hypothetical protein [Rhodospirillales bacterium]
MRNTGSAAVAFVAAGLLLGAKLDRPNLWDVAGGIVLVQATGGRVLERLPDGWRPFAAFAPGAASEDDLGRGR